MNIIKELNDYYNKDINNQTPLGFDYIEIKYLFVIDDNGRLVDIKDTTENKIVRKILAPKISNRGSNIEARILWDNVEYALGLTLDNDKKTKNRHSAFIQKLNQIKVSTTCNDFIADIDLILKFLSSHDKMAQIENHPLFTELKKPKINVSFEIDLHAIPILEHRKDELAKYIKTVQSNNNQIFCPIYGGYEEPAGLHNTIGGVKGENKQGKRLISFNLDSDSCYGMEASQNYQMSKKAAENYVKCLNNLINNPLNRNKISIGNDTIVWWCKDDPQIDTDFFNLLEVENVPKDNDCFKRYYDCFWKGNNFLYSSNKCFNVAILSSNGTRIGIKYFDSKSLESLIDSIRTHYNDLNIDGHPDISDNFQIFSIKNILNACMKSDVRNEKKIPPKIINELLFSCINNAEYPNTLYQMLMSRIMLEKFVNNKNYKLSKQRAGLLKAILNRKNSKNKNWRQISMGLDLQNNNIGYLLGRFLAVCEKVQLDINPNVQRTIKDRYFKCLADRPSIIHKVVESNEHHLKQNQYRIKYDKIICEIMDKIDLKNKDFPKILQLDDKGVYSLGYYQQKSSFYQSKQ